MKYYIGSIPFDSESALSHHGIIGQKWGVRRFQDEHGRLTPAGRERYGVGEADKSKSAPRYTRIELNSMVEADKKTYNDKPSKLAEYTKADYEEKNRIDHGPERKDTAKNVTTRFLMDTLSYGPLSVVSMAVRLGIAAHGNIKMDQYLKLREQTCKKDPKTGLYLKNEPVTNDEKEKSDDMKVINPDYNNFSSNTKNNCMLCTVAYDMRRRGYEVTSRKAADGYISLSFKDWYPNAEVKKVSPYQPADEINIKNNYYRGFYNNFLRDVKAHGDSRGAVMINTTNSGHCIAYEVNDGKVTFRDCQNNTKFSEADMRRTIYGIPGLASVMYARLDNAKPNMENVAKECVR